MDKQINMRFHNTITNSIKEKQCSFPGKNI